jgi:RHS repeat-associated protein
MMRVPSISPFATNVTAQAAAGGHAAENGGNMPAKPSTLVTRPVDELLGEYPGYGFAGYSVSTAIGNFTHIATDLGFPAALLGLLDYARTYNSRGGTGHPLGQGWAASFSARLSATDKEELSDTTGPVRFHGDDGRVLTFTPIPAGGYQRPQDLAADLTRDDSGFTLDFYDTGAAYRFDLNGRTTGRSQEGHTVSFDYDSAGRLLRATHSAGPRLNFSYDDQGRLTQAAADDGRSAGYAYGADGALATVTGPAGEVSHYTWTQGRLATFTDPDGNVLADNSYDNQGRVSSQVLPTGGTVEFGYDSATGATTVTSQPTDAVMTFTADSSGRLVKLDDPDGNTATFSYDENGYLSEAESPAGTALSQQHDDRGHLLHSDYGGASTAYSYDDQNRVASVQDPAGGAVRYTYSGSTMVPSSVTDQEGGSTQFTSAGGQLTTVTDADGNTTRYAYDPAGNLISVTDADGGVTRFQYDQAGHRIAQITPTGAETRWEYDATGRVTAVIDPDGNTTGYRYSAAGRLLATTDPTGAVTTHEYDTAGQLTAVTDPLGRTTRYAYDHDGNLTSTTAPGGAVSQTSYDHAGRVTATTDPTGAVTKYGYDHDGNLTQVTDPLGNVTHRAYDARGNLTEVTDPTGAVTKYSYDGNDREISRSDPNGNIWRTSYDLVGRVISTTDPTGAVEQQRWTKAGKLQATVDAIGNETRYAYTATGLLSSVTNPEGGLTGYAYDADGRRITSTSPAGLVTRYRYDPAARMVACVDPRDWITEYEYNARGQVTAVILPSGATTRSRYDPAGQLVETVDPNGSVTVYGYNPTAHLREVTDAKGAVKRFDYDAAGRPISFIDPLGRTTHRGYDAAGNLTSITDPDGQAQHFSYDGARHLLEQSAEDGTEVSYTYDPAGQRTSMTDGTGTTHYSYDTAGRLTTVTDPEGGTTTAGYDQAGQRTSLTYPSGLVLTYQYDQNGNLTALHDSRAGWARYALDPDGRLITEELPRNFARRFYYEHGLLARFTVFRRGHPVAQAAFRHDPDGRISTEHDADERRARFRDYRYDPAGQLVGVRHWDQRPWPWLPQHEEPGRDRPWPLHDTPLQQGLGYWQERRDQTLDLEYDAVGNRTSMRRGDEFARYRYDAADQLLARDAQGLRTDYSYDSSGRLTAEATGDHRRQIEYDGFGRAKLITQPSPWPAQRSQLTYNGNNLISLLELTNTSGRKEEESAASARYQWSYDPVPQILSQQARPQLDDAEQDRPGRLDADFAYGYVRTFASSDAGAAVFHTDAFDSGLRTPDTEPWVQADGYDVFGTPEGDRPDHDDGPWPDGLGHDGERPTLPPELPRFGYRGELAFGSTLYLRARNYDTTLGRFTTPDPLAMLPNPQPAVSPYAYANNDPVNQTDPLGLFSLGSIVSGIAHAAQHAVSGVVRGTQHLVHAVTGAVTHASHIIAGAAAAAYHAVTSAAASVARSVQRDAALAYQAVRSAASHVVHTVSDAVRRTVGMVNSGVSDAWSWIKKHNQIIGKIGSVLSNISGDLALAGAIIAPIPGLDFLTPVLEGAALATSIGAIGFQGIAKAAGDQNVTYGDLLNDAIGAIPGGEDAEDAERGISAASKLTDEEGGAQKLYHYTSRENYNRIMGGGTKDEITLKASKPASDRPKGVYVSPMSPADVGRKAGGFKSYLGLTREKSQYVIEFEADPAMFPSRLRGGRQHIWISPTDVDLPRGKITYSGPTIDWPGP